ncbi:hypothetical protein K1719_036834 [Acacia pycnantha]|nr:hypothetical protein K1719_036834 [Acacia pycnantha]
MRDFLRTCVDLVKQVLLLSPPQVAMASENLDDPRVGFGVFLPPQLHFLQLLFRLKELRRKILKLRSKSVKDRQ